MAAADRLTPDQLAAEVARPLAAEPRSSLHSGEAPIQRSPRGSLRSALELAASSSVTASTARQRSKSPPLHSEHTSASESSFVDAPVDAGPSLESRARDARWNAIASAVAAGEIVVTGHTQDDQAETVMMNLMRGSGSAGVAGMLRSRPGVVRPLLGFSRAAVRSLAEELGLPFVDDPANEDDSYLRNRIRRNLLPDLERTYATGVRATLARAGALAAADDHLIEGLTDDIPVVGGARTVSDPDCCAGHGAATDRGTQRAQGTAQTSRSVRWIRSRHRGGPRCCRRSIRCRQ